MWGAQALLEVRRRFLVGSGRPSMLMLVGSAGALATMRGDDEVAGLEGFITEERNESEILSALTQQRRANGTECSSKRPESWQTHEGIASTAKLRRTLQNKMMTSMQRNATFLP